MQILQHPALKHPNSVLPTQTPNHNSRLRGRGGANIATEDIQNGGITIHTGCQLVTYSGVLV